MSTKVNWHLPRELLQKLIGRCAKNFPVVVFVLDLTLSSLKIRLNTFLFLLSLAHIEWCRYLLMQVQKSLRKLVNKDKTWMLTFPFAFMFALSKANNDTQKMIEKVWPSNFGAKNHPLQIKMFLFLSFRNLISSNFQMQFVFYACSNVMENAILVFICQNVICVSRQYTCNILSNKNICILRML